MNNVGKEDLINLVKKQHPDTSLSDEQLSEAYDNICDTVTKTLYNTDLRVYLPKVGVLYKEKVPQKVPRLTEGDLDMTNRYKIKLSSKSFTLR